MGSTLDHDVFAAALRLLRDYFVFFSKVADWPRRIPLLNDRLDRLLKLGSR
jgi:hypothetical protein